MHTIKCKFGVSTISLMALAVFVANSLGDAQKIDAKIDLVVIWPTFDDANVLDSTKRKLAKLPELFLISDAKVKIAFVESNTNDVSQAVVFQLSGNETGFNNWINNWKPVSSTKVHVDTAFEAARTRVLQNGGERARMVVVMLRGWTIDIVESIKEAEKLRDAGVFIYAICQSDGAGCGMLASNWTGGSSRCIDVDAIEFNTDVVRSMKKLEDVILLDLCNWTSACRFEKRNQTNCTKDVLPSTSFFDDRNRQCHNSVLRPTTPAIECSNEDCVDECNRRWPWNVWPPNCDIASCGSKFYRMGDAPLKMEHCLAEISCPSCPTTSIASMTSTTSTNATASKTSTTSKTSIASTSETTAKESGMATWKIAAICLLIVLIVVAGIVAFFLWAKSKKQWKAEKCSKPVVVDLKKERSEKSTKSLSDLSKADAAPQKILPPLTPPSTPSKIHPPTEKSSSTAAATKGSSVGVQMFRKGAETSVAADIRDDHQQPTSEKFKGATAPVHKSEAKNALVKKAVQK